MKLFKKEIFLILSIALPAIAAAGEFQVSPIMLDLGKAARSGAITVSNVGNETINLQVEATEWKQDSAGKDAYTKTGDIVFFPKIISIEKGDAQLIRVGMKGMPPETEKSYRLYIQEIPLPKKTEKGKAEIGIAIRFGVPIFIKPVNEEMKGVIENGSMTKGTAKCIVKNSGNVHFKITTVAITGKSAAGESVFSKEIQGWYLLPGAAREYSAPVPKDVCNKLDQIQFAVKAEGLTLSGSYPVDEEMCRP